MNKVFWATLLVFQSTFFVLVLQMPPLLYWNISARLYVFPSRDRVALQNSAGWIVLRVPQGWESAVRPIKEKTTIFISLLTNNLLYSNSVLN